MVLDDWYWVGGPLNLSVTPVPWIGDLRIRDWELGLENNLEGVDHLEVVGGGAAEVDPPRLPV